MTIKTHVKVSGVWQPVKKMWAKVSGVWRPIKKAWVKIGGAWVQVFSAGFDLTAADVPRNEIDSSEVGFCKAPPATYFGTFGSIDPAASTINGAEVVKLTATHTYAGGYVTLWLAGSLAADFFTSITVNGITLLSANRNLHAQDIGCTYWSWAFVGDTGMRAGGTYSVSYT